MRQSSTEPEQSVRPSQLPARDPRTNTLGLQQRDLEILHDALATTHPVTHAPGTGKTRLNLRGRALQVSVMQPGGSESKLRMAARELTDRRVWLLHSCFVYPGAKCTVALERRSGEVLSVHGTIEKCEHLIRNVHGVAVCFDHPVDCGEFE